MIYVRVNILVLRYEKNVNIYIKVCYVRFKKKIIDWFYGVECVFIFVGWLSFIKVFCVCCLLIFVVLCVFIIFCI